MALAALAIAALGTGSLFLVERSTRYAGPAPGGPAAIQVPDPVRGPSGAWPAPAPRAVQSAATQAPSPAAQALEPAPASRPAAATVILVGPDLDLPVDPVERQDVVLDVRAQRMARGMEFLNRRSAADGASMPAAPPAAPRPGARTSRRAAALLTERGP